MWEILERDRHKQHKKMRTDWLGPAMREEEIRAQTEGFIAIYERTGGRISLYLRIKDALLDGHGRMFPDGALDWKEYGRGWRAYALAPFAFYPAGQATIFRR